jgi:phage-related protein
MHGMIFGEKHTYRDWGLLLKSRPEISPPSPKLKLIKVPGSNQVIDLTESLTGEVKYETRQITAEFFIVDNRGRWPLLYSEILTYLHGKSIRIIMDDDPNYFYTGRVTVGELVPDKKTAALTITAEVEPYKRERFGEGRRL